MTYTAEQLREDAHRADGIGTMADGDQLRAHADALETIAKLKEHAEAMATHWEKDDTMDLMASAVTAYRRDYPEGTK